MKDMIVNNINKGFVSQNSRYLERHQKAMGISSMICALTGRGSFLKDDIFKRHLIPRGKGD